MGYGNGVATGNGVLVTGIEYSHHGVHLGLDIKQVFYCFARPTRDGRRVVLDDKVLRASSCSHTFIFDGIGYVNGLWARVSRWRVVMGYGV